MKMTAILVFALALAAVVFADETYEVVLPTTQVSKVDLGRTQHNDDVCEAAKLESGCTQTNACMGVQAPCSGACSDAQAVEYGCRIYAGTPGEREAFVAEQMLPKAIKAYQETKALRDGLAASKWCETATSGDKTSLCATMGLGPDCYYPCGVPPES
jgi:hypothetical protein